MNGAEILYNANFSDNAFSDSIIPATAIGLELAWYARYSTQFAGTMSSWMAASPMFARSVAMFSNPVGNSFTVGTLVGTGIYHVAPNFWRDTLGRGIYVTVNSVENYIANNSTGCQMPMCRGR